MQPSPRTFASSAADMAANEHTHEPVLGHAELLRGNADGNGVAGVNEGVEVVRFWQETVHALGLLVERIHDGVSKVRIARELLEQRVGYVETILAYRGQDFGGYPALEALSVWELAQKHERIQTGLVYYGKAAHGNFKGRVLRPLNYPLIFGINVLAERVLRVGIAQRRGHVSSHEPRLTRNREHTDAAKFLAVENLNIGVCHAAFPPFISLGLVVIIRYISVSFGNLSTNGTITLPLFLPPKSC